VGRINLPFENWTEVPGSERLAMSALVALMTQWSRAIGS
jgi:hypothetical protein